MSLNGKLIPHLDEKNTNLLNLTVLQRMDRFVEEILMTATHVASYGFNTETREWGRKNVEGSLFVVKRNSQPRFQFIVMNRLSTDNLVETLLGDFVLEVQIPYLLYRNASQEVNGIWFYDPHECKEVAVLFSRILTALYAHTEVPTNSIVSATESTFKEQEAVSKPTVMDGSLEPSCSARANVACVPEDQSFVRLFNTPMSIGTSPHVAIPQQPYHSTPIVVSPYSQSVSLSALPSAQAPSSSATTPIMSFFENSEYNMKRTTDLVSPSSFFPSPSPPLIIPPRTSSVPTAPLNHPGNLQLPTRAPIVQPFQPPTTPSHLTRTYVPTPNHGPVISREKVREILQLLVQDNQFIDIIYQTLRMQFHES